MRRQVEPRVRYFSGLDLGQAQQFTALAVLEKTAFGDPADPAVPPPQYAVRHLERFPIGSPYPEVITRLEALFKEKPLAHSRLVVDQTGVGQPVIETLKDSAVRAEVSLVTITAGLKASYDAGAWLVPKKDLVGVLQVLLQSRRTKVAETLLEAATLVKELGNFRAKVAPSSTGNLLADWREAPHDDLVLAVAVAAWYAERFDSQPWGMAVPDVLVPGAAWWRW
jgi:hypothetical protein